MFTLEKEDNQKKYKTMVEWTEGEKVFIHHQVLRLHQEKASTYKERKTRFEPTTPDPHSIDD